MENDPKLAFVGEWTGTNQLFLDPPNPGFSSPSKLSIHPVANDGFLEFKYNWIYEAEEQQGVLLLGFGEGEGTATIAWIDSFHMSAKIMVLLGSAVDDGVNVLGSYAAPPGPDWGWRIVIRPTATSELHITMHNISPEGEETLAVQAEYTRAN